MIIGPDLDKSLKLFNKRKYTQTIEIINPLIKYYSDSFIAYKILGFSFLMLHDYGSAYDCIESAILKCGQNADYDLAYAYAILKLRKGENPESIKIMLDLMNKKKYVASIKHTLSIIKQAENQAVIINFLNEEIEYAFSSLKIHVDKKENKSIKIKKRYKLSDFNIFFIVFFAFIVISIISLLIYNFVPKRFNSDVDKITIEKTDLTSFQDKSYKIVLSELEIFSSFNRIKKYFKDNDDNLAQREINRIVNSNAKIEVKDKAIAFQRYFKEPTWKTLKSNFTVEEILKTPYLYENCFVSWKGRIANLVYTDTKISFDFLVGYEDKKFIKATVYTEVDFSCLIYEDLPYEMLSKVILKEDKFFLRVISIHRLDEKN